jgi:hypothetical protein
MAEPSILLDYKGFIDYRKIDYLLKSLRKHKEYASLGKVISKRVYSIVVECLENIAKHAVQNISGHYHQPSVLVVKGNSKIRIKASNLMASSGRVEVERQIHTVNNLDEELLRELYDARINNGDDQKRNCSGLGFMLMKLRSRNDIIYSFTGSGDYVWLEIDISVNQYIMRKLVLDQTSSTPKVILDPDRNRYEISGESRPPDVTGFYSDILNWFDDYSHQLLRSGESDPVEFNLDFNYFNSSSARYILDFCKKIADVRSKGKEIKVKWHYENDDIDMLETGREMSKMAKFPFEFCVKEI